MIDCPHCKARITKSMSRCPICDLVRGQDNNWPEEIASDSFDLDYMDKKTKRRILL